MSNDPRVKLALELYGKGFGPTEIVKQIKSHGLAPAIPRTVKNWLIKKGVYVSNPAYRRMEVKETPLNVNVIKCPHDVPTTRCKTCCPTSEAKARFNGYGITELDFIAMLDKQRHRCAICERVLAILPKAEVHIDHCHKSGKVRGVLCKRCNTGLYLFEEKKIRERATEYVLSARRAS